jgi:hypothetical protein
MIPQRFVTEYPERCGQLLQMVEPQARKRELESWVHTFPPETELMLVEAAE